MSLLICRCFGCEPVSPGFILPFCRYRPVQADAGMPAWSSLPTELELRLILVCTFSSTRVQDAVAALRRFKAPQIPVAAVATGFPSGQYSLKTRLEEIRMAVADGATEIDIVINRNLALNHQARKLIHCPNLVKEAPSFKSAVFCCWGSRVRHSKVVFRTHNQLCFIWK
jgi:hypothetical protein